MQKTLTIVPDRDRVDAWLTSQASSTDFVDARTVLTLGELVDRCAETSEVPTAVATPLHIQSTIAAACHRLAFDARHKDVRPEFVRRVQSTLSHLRMQLQSPDELEQVSRACDNNVAPVLGWLASIWRRVDAALLQQQLVDPIERLWRARTELLRTGVPASLRGFSKVAIRHVHDFFPARLQFFRAFAVACQQAKIALEIHWPATFVDQSDLFVLDAVRQIEADWQSLAVELFADECRAPGTSHGGDGAAPISSFIAPTPKGEIQEVARRIWRLMRTGVAVDAIAIVTRNVDALAPDYLSACDALGIPLRCHASTPLWATTPGRMALALLELTENDFPAEKVAEFLMLQGGGQQPDAKARALAIFQEASIRNDRIGSVDGRGAYAERLEQLKRRTRSRSGGAHRSVTPRESIDDLLEAVTQLIALCHRLPSSGTMAAHCEAWRQAVSSLTMHVPPSAFMAASANPASVQAIDRRFAETQAASEALSQFVEVLLKAIEGSALAMVEVSKSHWLRWLSSFGADVRVHVGSPKSGAVQLIELSQIAGHRFDHLFFSHLVEGRIPRSASAALLLGDDDAVRVNRAAGRRVFRTQVRDGDVADSLHVAEDRLLFSIALASARKSVTLSCARTDSGGREQAVSPFWEKLVSQKAIVDHTAVGYRHIPRFVDAACEVDLRMRAALLHSSPSSTRIDAGDRLKEASRRLIAEPWFEEIRTLAGIENERFRYFLSASEKATPWTGRLHGQALSILQRRLDFSRELSISAAELQTWATCPFQGFVSYILGVRSVDETGEEVSPATRGTYWHELLRQAVAVLEARGRLGSVSIAQDEIRRAIDEAAAAVVPHLASAASLGHPAVWQVTASHSANLLVQFVGNREVVLPVEGARPVHHELRFGTTHGLHDDRHADVSVQLDDVVIAAVGDDETPVRLNGKIDRIDLGEGVVTVIDYKTTVKERSALKSELFVTDFQMPIYLFVARLLFPERVPDAFWIGLLEHKARSFSSVFQDEASALRFVDMSAEGRAAALRNSQPNLANAVHQLLGRLRTGDLGPRSRSCDLCDFAQACRIAGRSPVSEKEAS